jgi:hypothetical protein
MEFIMSVIDRAIRLIRRGLKDAEIIAILKQVDFLELEIFETDPESAYTSAKREYQRAEAAARKEALTRFRDYAKHDRTLVFDAVVEQLQGEEFGRTAKEATDIARQARADVDEALVGRPISPNIVINDCRLCGIGKGARLFLNLETLNEQHRCVVCGEGV